MSVMSVIFYPAHNLHSILLLLFNYHTNLV
jgi:hypothetical protein